MENTNLNALGWTDEFADEFARFADDKLLPARVVIENKGAYIVMTEGGELPAKVPGSFRHAARARDDFPAVGDWVAIKMNQNNDPATIQSLLNRRSLISRKIAGSVLEQQIIASNVDYVFIVSGLDQEFNLRRIERFITMVWNSAATPVILLNKTDLLTDKRELGHRKAQIETIASGAPMHFISACSHDNLSQLTPYLKVGITVALLGASGVGKSTITNYLLGEERQKTQPIREADGKGRHTTRRRQLFLLPRGGLLIDTPGMRELHLWLTDENTKTLGFEDVEKFATHCQFSNCRHQQEPKCAVRQALENNELSPERFASYCKLQAELSELEEQRKDRKHAKKRHAKVIKHK